MASGHAHTDRLAEPIRILNMSFTASLLAEHHRRCHDCAEYLAQVVAPKGSDTGMTARELSACLFEILELIRSHHRPGRIELTLFNHPQGAPRPYEDASAARGDRAARGVEVRATLPSDEALAARYADWLSDPGTRDMLAQPRPGDGLLELAAVHNASVSCQRSAMDRLTLQMYVALNTDQADQNDDGEA
ncbi:hypothetical protein KKB55_09830 [Myxococcota bacterium]|nr:hypothetical protein [Myxococcota bacterium]MBU1898033.1 hypothetical protein [Myxococcota bacterium]